MPWFSPILGGHCVVAFDYDPDYLYVRTYGKKQAVEWPFVARYMDVGYAPVDPLWLGADGKSPGGLTLDQLLGDLPYLAAA